MKTLKDEHENLELQHGSLKIQQDKTSEQVESLGRDLKDTVDKLHATNKLRHETEIRLGEELEKNKTQFDALKLKEDSLAKKTQEIEDLDKRCLDLMRSNDATETKKQAIERQFELTKKQLNERISNLNEIMNGEKETREMWIERFDKE